jgi:hypothetical protein
VLLRGDHPGAGSRAPVDVVEQARPSGALRAVVHPLRAGAHREDPQQQVQRLADRVGVGVGAEAPVALGDPPALHPRPRDLLGGRQDQVRIRLVVAVAHVVARPVALDQRVLEVQRLHLGVDHDPLHRAGRLEHRPGAGRDRRPRLEVARQAAAQGLGLADVHHAAVTVAEQVAPRRLGDAAGIGAELKGRVLHDGDRSPVVAWGQWTRHRRGYWDRGRRPGHTVP